MIIQDIIWQNMTALREGSKKNRPLLVSDGEKVWTSFLEKVEGGFQITTESFPGTNNDVPTSISFWAEYPSFGFSD